MTTTPHTSAGDVLLADIIANPLDDDLRLIYADWLDDEGDHDRAEFIRLQIADGGTVTFAAGCLSPGIDPNDGRAVELIREHDEWLGNMSDSVFWRWHRGFIEEVHLTSEEWRAVGPTCVAAHPIQTVRLTDKSPRELGYTPPTMWQWDPVVHRAVPADNPTGIPTDNSAEPHVLSAWLWFHYRLEVLSVVQFWPTEEMAWQKLSQACLRYARAGGSSE